MTSTPAVRTFAIADWQAARSASARAVAPDGRTILYEVTHGQPKGGDVHEWWIILTDGTGRRRIVLPKSFHPFGFTRSPRELYGTVDVHGEAQLATWPLGARRARVLTALPHGVGSAVLSPDGSRYALLADPRPHDALAATRTIVANDAASLYVTGVAGGGGAWWCREHDQIGGFAWAPDGRRIATLSQTPKLGYHRVTSSIDVCSAAASRHVASVANATINEIPYPGAGIAWTADARELVFLSTTTDVITPDHLWTVPAAGGTPRDRTPDIDASVIALRGDAHGNVWTTVARGVQTEVDRYAGGALRPAFAAADAYVGLPAATELHAAPATLAFTFGDPAHTNEVAVERSGALQRITHEGAAPLRGITLGRVVRHRWTSADGIALEALVTFPPAGVARTGKFLMLPHGGPEANDQTRFDSFAQLFAAHGFVVMQPQYRGSTGYGSAHLQAIYQRFGDTAYRDVDAATTEAVARGWADPRRLAMFGWSAGGFMTAWTVTQNHRYRAAIEGAGITEWLSFITSSDVQQTDFDARPLEADPAPFLRYSAVMYAKDVTTPLLILHGAADERVPTYQGRELFVLLKERGKTVRMVTYPGSPHFPRLWQQRRDVVTEVFGWLDRFDR